MKRLSAYITLCLMTLCLVGLGLGCGSDGPSDPVVTIDEDPADDESPSRRTASTDEESNDDESKPRRRHTQPPLECNSPPQKTCVDGTLRQFGAGSEVDGECSYPATDKVCGAGCCDNRCCEFVPSNAAIFGGFEATGVVTGPPDGEFDTDTDCTADAAMGICEVVPTGDLDLPDYCVCKSDELIIGNVDVVGSRALVLIASREITVEGRLSVSARSDRPGPGSVVGYIDVASGRSGGAGGSFGGVGGSGGDAPFGTPELSRLTGGSDGQGTCGRLGGYGGGALQLSAAESITIEGSVIAAGGAGRGGSSGDSCNGGSGGGSGGAILIEAPTANIRGNIAANGGGGGSGGTTDYSGSNGAMGTADRSQASGGGTVRDDPCLLYPYVYSGGGGLGGAVNGAAGSGGSGDYETRCLGNTYSGDGGGGGATGRVRVNTARGAQACICNGEFSPEPTFGLLVGE